MTPAIWFGQFNTVGGAVLEEGPFIGIFEGDARAPDGVGVYILVEPCGGASPDLCATTVEVIARGFGEPGQPLTASLLQALNAADAYVRGFHPGAAHPEFGVGISVLAVRSQEAYIAQAGPALACVRSGGVARIVEPPAEARARPVGGGARLTPSFARFQLKAGDAALLMFSSAVRLAGRQRLPALASQSPEQALPDLYLRSREERDFAALYLAVTAASRASVASVPSGPVSRARGRVTAAPAAISVTRPRRRGARIQEREEEDAPPAADERSVDVQRNGHGETLAGAVRTVLPRRTTLPSMSSGPSPFTRRRFVMAAAGGGVALLALMALPSMARQGKSEKFTQLVRGADAAIAAAERELDLAKRRLLLERAQATLDEARTLNAKPGDLAGLEQRVTSQLADLDGVRELTDLVQVADLAAPGLAAPQAGEIAVGPLVYALDATAGKVMGIPREGDPRPVTVFEEGRPAGQNRTGKARHITWWPAEGTRASVLLVLDDQRRLYAVDARGDIRPLALGETGEWKSDTAMAAATSQFYLLDATGNQVWRYTLSGGGFPGAPEPMLGARAVLKDAVSLSVAGGPVVAISDGRLLRIVEGREQLLQPVALDRPLLAPAAPILNAPDGLLYIADRGNQRVVRLSPDGAFRGQLTHFRLAGLRALTLDEAQGTLYAIAGQAIVKATIPR